MNRHLSQGLLAVLATFAALAAAQAQSLPQPAIDPVPLALQIVARLQIGGGVPNPGGIATRILTVARGGAVNVQEFYFPKDFSNAADKGTRKEVALANLQPEELQSLAQAVSQIKGGALEKSDAPGCTDAPGSTYEVDKGAKKIVIFRVEQCRQEPLRDRAQQTAAHTITTLLDRLMAETEQQ